MRELVQGDIVEVRLTSGVVHRYRVTAMATVPANPDFVDLYLITGPTDHDVITLITCSGTFDEVAQDYDQRLIVRAERFVGDVS